MCVNSFNCNCSQGFIWNHCVYMIAAWASQPCRNNGMCIDVAVNDTTTFNCQCVDGFTVEMCKIGEHL